MTPQLLARFFICGPCVAVGVWQDRRMAAEPKWRELGDFLRARRAELRPHDLGLTDDEHPRRVPGLRREEVARAASISTDYYTRLEQGRLPASAPVLDDLARVLRLSSDERAYLSGLAGKVVPVASPSPGLDVAPFVLRMIEDLVATPVFVMGPRTEVVAWNAMAASLITDFSAVPEGERYFIRLLFTDPALRTLYTDWLGVVDLALAQLRMDSARDPEDPRLRALIAELVDLGTEFEGLWMAHEVATRGTGTKVLRHPVVGELTLDWGALDAGGGYTAIVWTAEPGSPSQEGLRRLADLGGAERRS